MRTFFVFCFLSLFLIDEGVSLDMSGHIQKIQKAYPGVRTILPERVLEWRQDGLKFLLVDVRSEREFLVGHLASAMLVEPKADLKKVFKTIDKEQTIILYCSVGYRSAKMGKRLQKLGFKEVYNLQGGIFEWKNKGYPVFQADTQSKTVHPYNKRWGKLLK